MTKQKYCWKTRAAKRIFIKLFENIEEKKRTACDRWFSFSHNVFYLVKEKISWANSWAKFELLSANILKLDKCTFCWSCDKVLNLYHRILSYNNFEKEHLKTLWKKEKMLVTSIFFFSYNVFYTIKYRKHHFSKIYFFSCIYFPFGQVLISVLW